jgi:DNA-binding transcriptional LysR family regulator
MNVHHLELFYHTVKYRGISQAARFMPYGIQQPAISSQLLLLEENLKVKLFHRRPFNLTPAGEELYRFITPFFGQLGPMAEKLSGQLSQRLNLAASSTILRDYVPALVDDMRSEFPAIALTTCEIEPGEAETILQTHEVDLAISILEKKPGPGIQLRKLMEIPMVLLVPARSIFTTATKILTSEIFRQQPLISLPRREILPQLFNRELNRRHLEWAPAIEVNSLQIIQEYVIRKFGIGLSVLIPGRSLPASLKTLPLPHFPKIIVAALWRGQLSPIASSFLRRLESKAQALQKNS